MNIKVGDKVQFQMSNSDGSTIRFKSVVVKHGEGEWSKFSWVKFSRKVRSLPFPPAEGKRYGLYSNKFLEAVKVNT